MGSETRKNRAMPKPQQKIIKTALRLPIALHADIVESAAQHGHSMNDEMIARLSAPASTTLDDIAAQNMRTQEMVQVVIDAMGQPPGP